MQEDVFSIIHFPFSIRDNPYSHCRCRCDTLLRRVSYPSLQPTDSRAVGCLHSVAVITEGRTDRVSLHRHRERAEGYEWRIENGKWRIENGK